MVNYLLAQITSLPGMPGWCDKLSRESPGEKD